MTMVVYQWHAPPVELGICMEKQEMHGNELETGHKPIKLINVLPIQATTPHLIVTSVPPI